MARKATKQKAKAKAAKEPAAKKGGEHAHLLQAFAADFTDGLPIEARGGSYGATVRDRWHGKTFEIADGEHEHSGWLFRFKGGAFVKATRVQRRELKGA